MNKISITQKLLVSYVVLVVIVAALSVTLILPGQIEAMNKNLENTLSRLAYILAHDREVIESLSAGECSINLLRRLDNISATTKSSIDYIVLADTRSIRVYHPDKALIGKKFTGGDECEILNGDKEKLVTTHQGRPDIQKRAFHVVKDYDGEIIGFVMASTSTKSIELHKQDIVLNALGFLAISLTMGLLLAYGITQSIKRILLGYDPTTFAQMYLQREEILDKLNEGVIVVNEEQLIIYKNLPSQAYIKGDFLSKQSPIYPGAYDCFKWNITIPWSMVELEDKSFLVSMIPLKPLENLDAVMVILRNRTEFVKLTEQLTGSNHIIDALRANTHEFRNKLHIISGFLQVGDTKRAMEFISEEAMNKNGQNILRLIKDKTVAALLLGKANRAAEMNIDFELRRDSNLPEKNPFLTTKELVLIIGNLIENSFEAMTLKNPRQVEFFIDANPQGLTITVDDTGCGMTEQQIKKFYSGSYTTKGAGHGYGMKLIREVIDRHNGFLQIDSEPDAGTSITININFERGEQKNNIDKCFLTL